MFAGGGAAMFTNDNFNGYNKRVREGAVGYDDPGSVENRQRDAKERENEADEGEIERYFVEAMSGASEANGAMGSNMPVRNVRDGLGYDSLSNPAALDKESMLPFDTAYDSTKNYKGIVNAFGAQRFGASEQIVNSLMRMEPFAQRALKYKGSLYDGVVDNFAVNRLYIANQRNREDNVYAFV